MDNMVFIKITSKETKNKDIKGNDMELKDTINYMISNDYKDRFFAEYAQLRIRYSKLRKLVSDYYNGKLNFETSCPIQLLKAQLDVMKKYLDILEARSTVEEITKDVTKYFNENRKDDTKC